MPKLVDPEVVESDDKLAEPEAEAAADWAVATAEALAPEAFCVVAERADKAEARYPASIELATFVVVIEPSKVVSTPIVINPLSVVIDQDISMVSRNLVSPIELLTRRHPRCSNQGEMSQHRH